MYLIEKFKNLGDPSDWTYAVGPHCHNYKARTDRVVLQYPPLTGLFLSLFFEGAQVRRNLALVEVILVAFLSFIAINSRVPTAPLLAAALGAFLLVGLKGYGWSLSIVGSTLLLTFLGYLTVSISNASTRRGRMAAGFLLVWCLAYRSGSGSPTFCLRRVSSQSSVLTSFVAQPCAMPAHCSPLPSVSAAAWRRCSPLMPSTPVAHLSLPTAWPTQRRFIGPAKRCGRGLCYYFVVLKGLL